jgi:two-component system sensor histidine kinase KdpD
MATARYSDERVHSRLGALLADAFPEHIGFLWGALTNVVTTTIAFLVAPHAQLAHLMIIHLVGAVLISTRYGMAVSTFTAVTGVLAFDYYCIPPVFAFAMPDPRNVISFTGMLLVALLVCWLNQGLRYQRAAAHASEERTRALCQLSLDLSQLARKEELKARAQSHLRGLFGERTELWLTNAEPPSEPGFEWHAIRDHENRFGYIRVDRAASLSAQEERHLLLAACADRVADAVKLLALGEAARRAEVDTELERNRNALLSAVSHDMKTPLASIMTAGSSLLRDQRQKDPATRELFETIVQESERMNGMITNLLNVTRLESGNAILNKEIEAIDDLVFAVLSRFSRRLVGRQVRVDIPKDLPMVSVDPVLIEQLLANLLENALRYTPGGSAIEISGTTDESGVSVAVSDHGPGISAMERERVFERFYRGLSAKHNDGGTGLGLTICRAVVHAHGGSIGLFSREGGGTSARFTLPFTATGTAVRLPNQRRPEA